MRIGRYSALGALLWGVAVVCTAFRGLAADVIISEFMAVNDSTLQDEDGDYPDWIELYNTTSSDVNLAGWSLTDDASQLQKWVFPATNLPAHGFLVVFASDKNRAAAGQPLHTNFKLDGDGEYLALVRPGGAGVAYEFAPAFPAQTTDQSYGVNWTVDSTVLTANAACKAWVPADDALGTTWVQRTGFNDSGWRTGTGGVGYDADRFGQYVGLIGLNLQDLMYEKHPTAYVRIPFTLGSTAEVASATLSLTHDDGFVAYLNGTPIAAALAPATPRWDSSSTGERDDNLVLEAPSAFPVPNAADLFTGGGNVLAIHLMNRAAGDSDLLLLPELTVSLFALGSLDELRYFAAPSPGARNTTGFLGTAKEPVFSVPGGTATTNFSLTVSTSSSDTTIRYTTDGSLPTASSLLYAGPILVSGTTMVRAQASEPGFAASPVHTETYLFLEASAQAFSSDLPLVIVDNLGAGDIPSVEPKQSAVIAVFEKPPAGATTLLQSPVLQSRAGIRRRGESTLRPTNKKPNLGVETRAEYDDVARDIEPLGLPAESDWILFAPWRWDPAFIRNTLAFQLCNEAGQYASRTRFVEVFLNADGGPLTTNDYVGVYVLEERIKRDNDRVDIAALQPGDDGEPAISGGYLFRKDKPDPDKPEFTAGGVALQWYDPASDDLTAHQKTWLTDYIDAFYAALNSARFTDPVAGYGPYIDADNWVRVNIINMFMKNIDWPALSTYFHKDRNRPIRQGPAWDFDRSAESKDGRDDAWNTWNAGASFFSSYWWARLFQDPDFWQRYIDTWQTLRETTLSESNVFAIIDVQTNEISNGVARDYARWPAASYAEHYPRTGSNGLDGTWPGEVTYLKWWLSSRLDWVDSQFVERPVFSQPGGAVANGYELTITVPLGATVYYTLDGSDPRAPGGSVSATAVAYSPGAPIAMTRNMIVRARATDGSLFYSAPSDAPWSGLREAVFSVGTPALVVSELMYRPARPTGTETNDGLTRSDYEYIELRNVGGETVGLAGVRLAGGVTFDFSAGDVTALGPGETVVAVGNATAFARRYPGVSGTRIAGEFAGDLDDAGEEIRLLGPTNETLAAFTYSDGRGWPVAADGAGHSLVPLYETGQADGMLDYGRHWRPSKLRLGSPGRVNPPPITDLVVNELAAHTDYPAPFYSDDWIELFNTGATSVSLAGWYLSDDPENLAKWAIPGTNEIAGGAFKTFDEVTGFHNPTNTGFGLDKAGEQVLLSYLPGTGSDRVADAVRFKAQENGVTLGRYGDGGEYWYKLVPTTNSPNASPGEHVVIEELMYHPVTDTVPPAENTTNEYIELSNPLDAGVELWSEGGPWRIDGGVSYTFPTNTVLPPGGRLLVVSFAPDTDAASMSVFTAAYGPTHPATRILGPYSGKLSNHGERVAIEKPLLPDAVGEDVSWSIVDEAIYFDRTPWSVAADGAGASLQRLSRIASGNDPASWAGLAPTPGWPTARAAISVPLNNADVFVPADIAVSVAVDDTQTVSPVQGVELYFNGASVGVDATPPYDFAVTGIATPGAHALWGVLTDGAGTYTTATVNVNALRLSNDGVSNVTDYGATVYGELAGSAQADISLYWGPTDGGEDVDAWANRSPLGVASNAGVSAALQTLDPGVTYFYRFHAVSSSGSGWSPAGKTFSTLSYAEWPHRMDVTFAGYDGIGALTNFPALMRLSPAMAGFSYGQFTVHSGGDLRFSDASGTRTLPYEIEAWDTNGISIVWVLVPELAGTNTTIRAYWGNPAAGAPPPFTTNGAVWQTFAAVWHFGPGFMSSAPDGIEAADHGSLDAAGIVGRGRGLDGSAAYIDPTIGAGWYGSHIMGLTLSVWVRPDAREYGCVLGSEGGDRDLFMQTAGPTDRFPRWAFGVANHLNVQHTFDLGAWANLALVLDAGEANAFRNGSGASSVGAYNAFAPIAPLLAGCMNTADGRTNYLEGVVDEIRISGVVRSPDWIRAEYRTVAENDTFTTYDVLPPTLLDGDGDGMPDGWEMYYFAATNAPHGGAFEDWDSDGVPNWGEYLGGTDPTDAASRFALEIRCVGPGVHVMLPTVKTVSPWYDGLSRIYDLQGAPGLTGVGWQIVPGYGNIPATGDTVVHTNLNDSYRFFRGKARLE